MSPEQSHVGLVPRPCLSDNDDDESSELFEENSWVGYDESGGQDAGDDDEWLGHDG